MKSTTTLLLSLLLAARGSLGAPVPSTTHETSEFESHTITIVRVSRHRGALGSFIASEEVSSTLRVGKDGSSIRKAGHSFDNSPLDLDGLDIPAPSPIVDIEQPLPTSYLLSLTAPAASSDDDTTTSSTTTEAPAEVNWAMALLKDVYADYRSVSPCWRQGQDGPDATTRIQRLVQGKADTLVIAGVACIVMFILVLEALFTAIQGLRRSLINVGAIRLEGPERALDSSEAKQEVVSEYTDEKRQAAMV